MKYRLQIALPLWLVYMALAQKPLKDIFQNLISGTIIQYLISEKVLQNLVFGAIIAIAFSFLFPPRPRPFDWSGVLPFFIGLLQYSWLVIKDMFKSAYNVAKIVLDPRLPIRPGIIAIDAGCKSELATALSAHAITLTPGEMVVAMDENGVLYTHTLDIDRSDEYAEQAQSLRRNLLSKLVS
jgi:multicomponent Na+:H+ antiporter subunit E